MATIFVSYAHEDHALIEELRKHLTPLAPVWWDGEIPPGAKWNAEIERQLDEADLVLLGISADFLNSQFIREHELPRALRRSGPVIPIILRPCLWEKEAFAHLQVLCGDAPVTTRDHDQAFTQVAAAIANLLEVVRAAIHNLPLRRNRHFIGRDALLATIHEQRGLVALHGLGGIGKTQIALEYAYRYGDQYDLIWWIDSAEPTTRASMYADLAPRLGLPAADQPAAIAIVRQELEHRDRWLLIFDNVEEPKDLDPYLPRRGEGHALITSRAQTWGAIATALTVQPLEREASIELILSRTGQLDRQAANELAEELGDLPLALAQAGAYLEKTAISVAQYLCLFRTRRTELWHDEAPPLHYPATVATTWSLAVDEVLSANEYAIHLMTMAALLAPEPIPRFLITSCAKCCPGESSGRALADPLLLNRAIAALCNHSLIDADESGIRMHRLVQAVVRDRLGGGEVWRKAILLGVLMAFPAQEPSSSSTCAILMPHALLAAADVDLHHAAGMQLLRRMAYYASYLAGNLTLGASLLDQAIVAAAKVSRMDVAKCLHDRATLAYHLEDFFTCLELFEQCIAIKAKYPQHALSLASSLLRYVYPLEIVGNLQKADEVARRAAEIFESHGDRIGMAKARDVLARLLWIRGRIPEALKLEQQVIEVLASSPQARVAECTARMNAAQMALEGGDAETAHGHATRVIAIQRDLAGQQHPDFGICLAILGEIEAARGNAADAVAALENAKTILVASYGPDHRWTARVERQLQSLRP
ncbi:MAG TPA: FxSxx-COOH system tetratricopeptide repeat protein [Thermoanaerobaculia bacterium]|jgi:tetratricopeptide (TPR) repeat protein|nr:FxSxx-COOH system tetratricopeptide repeat protein [Thermoanaerobaculia bacterium]